MFTTIAQWDLAFIPVDFLFVCFMRVWQALRWGLVLFLLLLSCRIVLACRNALQMTDYWVEGRGEKTVMVSSPSARKQPGDMLSQGIKLVKPKSLKPAMPDWALITAKLGLCFFFRTGPGASFCFARFTLRSVINSVCLKWFPSQLWHSKRGMSYWLVSP